MPPKERKRSEYNCHGAKMPPADDLLNSLEVLRNVGDPAALPPAPTRRSIVDLGDNDYDGRRPTKMLKMRLRVEGQDPVEQLDAHIIELLNIREFSMDQSDIPCLATSRIAGSGKTELLHLCETWDTFATPAGAVRERAADHQRQLNSMLPNGSSRLSHFVVLYATYKGKGVDFDPVLDTALTVENRLLFRFALNYYGDGCLASGYQTTCDFLAAVRKTVDAKHPETDGVLLCVDEVTKLEGGLHRILLSRLAGVQQEELLQNLPTIMLVTSSNLWPVVEEYLTGSKRMMSSLDLPMLPTTEVRDVLVDAFHALVPRPSKTKRAVWEHFVTATLDATGGHPTLLYEAFAHITVCTAYDDPTHWTEAKAHSSFEAAAAIWTNVLAKQIAERKPKCTFAEYLG